MEDEISAKFRLEGILTVVDSFHIETSIAHSKEAQEQIAFADIILLNKVLCVHFAAFMLTLISLNFYVD